ncbi:MAG: hypothetical protein KIS96_11800 [Bauldia sp.]|nr:hypothetical protein [Bauldia sp.]
MAHEPKPRRNPTPQPAECWGLYDGSGKLHDTDADREFLHHLWADLNGRLPDDWTIRPVVVTVKEES